MDITLKYRPLAVSRREAQQIVVNLDNYGVIKDLTSGFAKLFADDVTITDEMLLKEVLLRLKDDNLNLTESVCKETAKYLVETLTLGETLKLTPDKSFLDTILTDCLCALSLNKNTADMVFISELKTTLLDKQKTDTIEILETLIFSYLRAFAENITLTDIVAKSFTKAPFEDFIGVSETIELIAAFLQELEDTVGVKDTSFALDFSKDILESVAVSEYLMRTFGTTLSTDGVAVMSDISKHPQLSYEENLSIFYGSVAVSLQDYAVSQYFLSDYVSTSRSLI
jgi:hypothetical protein